MSLGLIEKARQKILCLQQDIDFLEQFIIDVQTADALIASDRPAQLAPDAAQSRVSGNPKPAQIIPAVVSILRERGRPMSRRELHIELCHRNIIVRGVDPTKTLGTILWRCRPAVGGPILSIEDRGYWPIDDPIPPAIPRLAR